MKYSVVMPSYTAGNNAAHMYVVEECLKSVKESLEGLDAELIIVQDGGMDMDGLNLKADIFIQHRKNMGIGPSWNDGMAVARGYYIAVINDDITVEKGWLEALEDAVNWPNAMVSAPGVKGKENFHGIEENYQWFPGYCFMLTQDTVDKIGTFDEQFTPFNYEDTDYWTRVLQDGGLLMRNYSTIITHKEGDVLHKLNYDAVSAANKEKFMYKHNFDPLPVFYEGEKAPWEHE